MPQPKTLVSGQVVAVATEQRSFRLAASEKWFSLSPRRSTTSLPSKGQYIRFDAYGPEQNVVYTFDLINASGDPEPKPMLQSQAIPPKDSLPVQPRYWTSLQLVTQAVEPPIVEGYFQPLGSPVWGVIDRKTGNVYPLTSVLALLGAVK